MSSHTLQKSSMLSLTRHAQEPPHQARQSAESLLKENPPHRGQHHTTQNLKANSKLSYLHHQSQQRHRRYMPHNAQREPHRRDQQGQSDRLYVLDAISVVAAQSPALRAGQGEEEQRGAVRDNADEGERISSGV